ncbi:beta-N-acetylhexosaminidase [Altererythrobacter indicus]|uniref:beta-N-acetylhexosaminidase n=1 Tax=Altericroceibacterium indicum TaxID=374177 RepID=A0A845A9M1_9SPHN|nr:beta-N-acetylhexosaminidase [Altericroceibacterium indicum]MXP25711.1 beta-N-acetylhexosaminidase [Altericroceibacterium indicum]
MTPAIFGLSGPVLTADERAFFQDSDPAGYVLFGRNAQNREQLRTLTDALRSIHGRDNLYISVDQEGGRVARMKAPEWRTYPAGAVFDRLYHLAPTSAIEAVRSNAHALGLDLAEVGITVDYTPLLDIRHEGADEVMGDRVFGADPLQVAALGRASLQGLARAGVAGCIKHMPGHGRATVDSHKELPTVIASAEELDADLAAFRPLANAPIGMTAHVRYPAWDGDNPATLSPTIIKDIIRGEIGFSGLLITDDVDMEALSGTVPERAEQAIAAGCDLVLNCWAKMDDMQGIAARLPAISDGAKGRLDAALANTHVTAPDDLSEQQEALLAKRDALLGLAEQTA